MLEAPKGSALKSQDDRKKLENIARDLFIKNIDINGARELNDESIRYFKNRATFAFAAAQAFMEVSELERQ